MFARTILFCLVLMTSVGAGTALGEDLRQKYATRSSQCAEAIHKAIQAVQARNPRQAEVHAREAVKHDATCVMAWYWLATANIDLGNVDKGMEYFEKTVDVSLQKWGGKVDNIGADACVNLGLTLIQLAF